MLYQCAACNHEKNIRIEKASLMFFFGFKLVAQNPGYRDSLSKIANIRIQLMINQRKCNIIGAFSYKDNIRNAIDRT